MSSDQFKAMFDEAREAGLPDEWIGKFESAFEATPLRAEIKSTKERMKELAETNTRYRDQLLATQFAAHGVTIPPKALRLPDDLDPTNDESVEKWLVDAGLTTTKPTTDTETLSTHDRIANAASDPIPPNAQLPDIHNMTEDQFWAAHEAGLLTPKK